MYSPLDCFILVLDFQIFKRSVNVDAVNSTESTLQNDFQNSYLKALFWVI